MPPPPTILHHNGRREVSVLYQLGPSAPQTGPAREALDEQIRAAIQQVHRPAGYTLEAPRGRGQSCSWFKKILVPVLLLLFAVLAVTFESLTLPLLVLLALPLTVLGATWALVLAGMPAGLHGPGRRGGADRADGQPGDPARGPHAAARLARRTCRRARRRWPRCASGPARC